MGIIAVGITGRNDGSTIRNLPIDAAPDDAQVPEQTEFLAVGTVLSGGAALPGATVTLTGPVSDAIVTDGVGTFTFEEIPAGAYVLTPQATGFTFAPETIALTITDANSRDNDFAGTLIVPEIESITPPSVLFGSPATDIAITGGPFIGSSEVVFDGLPLPTTLIDDGMLGTRLEETLLVLGREGQMLVRNTGPGGDTVSSDPEAFVVGSPAPSISALGGVPEPLIAGNSGFDLRVLGADFLEDASVLVNDVARSTTFVDETELVATIPADDLAAGGTLTITAANPSPTVGPSNELLVDVFSQIPGMISITPTSATVRLEPNSPSLTLSVKGFGYLKDAVVLFGSEPLPTTFLSSTALTATLEQGLMDTGGSFAISVQNPPPTLGQSEARPLILNNLRPVLESVDAGPLTFDDGRPNDSYNAAVILNGANFGPTSGATVSACGAAPVPVTGVAVNTQQIVATVTIKCSGDYFLTVGAPQPGGGGSATESFNVAVAGGAAAPTIATLNPNIVAPGSPSVTITISGGGFVAGALVNFGTAVLTPDSVAPTVIVVTVPGLLLGTSGFVPVSVTNPDASGSTKRLFFSVFGF